MHKLSATIGEIYEAAINPNHWDVALTSIISHSNLPNWDVAFLVWEQKAPPFGRFLGATGVADYVREGYINFFAGRNPWSERVLNLPTGSIVHSDELIPRHEFKETALYKNFLHTWEMETAIIASIDEENDARLGLVMPGPDNGSTKTLTEVLHFLSPHIQRACRISKRLGEADLKTKSALSILENTQNGILLLTRDFEVSYINPVAKELVDNGYFETKNNRLRINCRNSEAKIKAFASNQEAPTMAINIAPINRPLRRGLLMAVPVHTAKSLIGELNGAAFILIVNEEDNSDAENTRNLLRDWFDLTPAESRLALALTKGMSLELYAHERGVSVNAARFLLRGIYHKTATNKLGQLLKVLNERPKGFIV